MEGLLALASGRRGRRPATDWQQETASGCTSSPNSCKNTFPKPVNMPFGALPIREQDAAIATPRATSGATPTTLKALADLAAVTTGALAKVLADSDSLQLAELKITKVVVHGVGVLKVGNGGAALHAQKGLPCLAVEEFALGLLYALNQWLSVIYAFTAPPLSPLKSAPVTPKMDCLNDSARPQKMHCLLPILNT